MKTKIFFIFSMDIFSGIGTEICPNCHVLSRYSVYFNGRDKTFDAAFESTLVIFRALKQSASYRYSVIQVVYTNSHKKNFLPITFIVRFSSFKMHLNPLIALCVPNNQVFCTRLKHLSSLSA